MIKLDVYFPHNRIAFTVLYVCYALHHEARFIGPVVHYVIQIVEYMQWGRIPHGRPSTLVSTLCSLYHALKR